jgi:hypothetical protein
VYLISKHPKVKYSECTDFLQRKETNKRKEIKTSSSKLFIFLIETYSFNNSK